jgi:hypothetical protein
MWKNANFPYRCPKNIGFWSNKEDSTGHLADTKIRKDAAAHALGGVISLSLWDIGLRE